MPAPQVGEIAPDFKVMGLDQQIQSLDDLVQEQGALIIFFKTECPTCQLTFPFVERLYQILKDSPLRILAVGQNTPEELKAFSEKYELSLPMASETEPYPWSTSYDLISVPTFFLVDPGKTVRFTFTGHSKKELEALLKEASQLAGGSTSQTVFSDADQDVRELQPG